MPSEPPAVLLLELMSSAAPRGDSASIGSRRILIVLPHVGSLVRRTAPPRTTFAA